MGMFSILRFSAEVDAWERVASKTVGNRIYTVFNICGNRFRLVVQINHRHKMMFFKRLMTRAEYDRSDDG